MSFQKAHCLDHGMENNFIQGVENDVYAHVTQRHAAIVIQTGNIKVEDNIDNEDDMEEDAMGKEHEDLFDDVEDCCSCHKSKKAEETFHSCSVCLNMHCHVCNNLGKHLDSLKSCHHKVEYLDSNSSTLFGFLRSSLKLNAN